MNARKASLPILLVLLVFGVPSALLAQSETGTITGTVTDQSGAVVPGSR